MFIIGLLDSINDVNNLVYYGNRSDICVLCKKELAAKENMEIPELESKLRGELSGEKILKIRHSGADIIICLDHIHKLAKDNPLNKKKEK